MLVFVVAVALVILSLVAGLGLALGWSRLDQAVQASYQEMEEEERSYNPAQTIGHRIKVASDYEKQIGEARRLAARRAAAIPRGANMRIGSKQDGQMVTASQALDDDPMTAVRIAAHHGWDGARSGIPSGAAVAAPTAAPVAAPAKDPDDLIPGEDYPFIEVTDDMPDSEKRRARIANAKARSAAVRAAKAAVEASGAQPATATAPAAEPATASAPQAAATPTAVPPPELIEITDDMAPEDKRKARIANAKANSAYKKALKEAGVTASAPPATEAPAAEAPAAAAPAESSEAVDTSSIAPPDVVEITDDMSPEDKRKYRIQNAKERARYNKALKEAGIDPKSLS